MLHVTARHAVLDFEGGKLVEVREGGHVTIPTHLKHGVNQIHGLARGAYKGARVTLAR